NHEPEEEVPRKGCHDQGEVPGQETGVPEQEVVPEPADRAIPGPLGKVANEKAQGKRHEGDKEDCSINWKDSGRHQASSLSAFLSSRYAPRTTPAAMATMKRTAVKSPYPVRRAARYGHPPKIIARLRTRIPARK